jgi:membrane protein YdbS with pleckstrin-like domain
MLTKEEKGFITYWEQNRLRKKRLLWQLAAGLPMGVFLAAAIFLNFFSGWHRRAEMKLLANSSGSLVILLALILIVVFIVVFSSRHRWEMNEQRYKELIARKDT